MEVWSFMLHWHLSQQLLALIQRVVSMSRKASLAFQSDNTTGSLTILSNMARNCQVQTLTSRFTSSMRTRWSGIKMITKRGQSKRLSYSLPLKPLRVRRAISAMIYTRWRIRSSSTKAKSEQIKKMYGEIQRKYTLWCSQLLAKLTKFKSHALIIRAQLMRIKMRWYFTANSSL